MIEDHEEIFRGDGVTTLTVVKVSPVDRCVKTCDVCQL